MLSLLTALLLLAQAAFMGVEYDTRCRQVDYEQTRLVQYELESSIDLHEDQAQRMLGLSSLLVFQVNTDGTITIIGTKQGGCR